MAKMNGDLQFNTLFTSVNRLFNTIFNWKFSHLFVSWFTCVYIFFLFVSPPTASLSKPTGKIRFSIVLSFFSFHLSANKCLLSKEMRWIKSIGKCNIEEETTEFECTSILDLPKINARENLEHFFLTCSFGCLFHATFLLF